MSDWLDTPKRLGSPDSDRENLQGGPDFDTVRGGPDMLDQIEDPDRDEEADNPRQADERSGAPFPTHGPDPTGDDPHMAGALDDVNGDRIEEGSGELPRKNSHPKLDPSGEDGPTYERDQGPRDDHTGGSSDPHNTLSHADSGTIAED